MVASIFLVFAFVLFTISAFGLPNPPQRWNLVAAGLAFWVLSILVGNLHLIH